MDNFFMRYLMFAFIVSGSITGAVQLIMRILWLSNYLGIDYQIFVAIFHIMFPGDETERQHAMQELCNLLVAACDAIEASLANDAPNIHDHFGNAAEPDVMVLAEPDALENADAVAANIFTAAVELVLDAAIALVKAILTLLQMLPRFVLAFY